jgi:hypothetical protein
MALAWPVSVAAVPPKIATTLTAVSDPDPAWVGDTVTVTFTVTPVPDGGYVTLGGAAQYAVDTTTGTATYERPATSGGTPEFQAWFSGTDRYLASPVIIVSSVVRQHPVTATLEVPDRPVGRGDPFEVVVDLDEAPDGGRILIQDMVSGGPGPTLKYVDVVGPMPMTISMPGMEPRSYSLRASYEGTAAYASAVSPTMPLEVFDRLTTMTLDTSPEPTLWGEAATATVTFDPIPDDGGGASLSIDGGWGPRFEMDWDTGRGTVELPYMAPGQHTVRAMFQPSGYLVSRWAPTSAELTHTVSSTAVDQDPPVGTVSINDGDAITFEGYVVVSMHATDASTIYEVDMSCDGVTWVDGGTVDGTWGWGFGNETCSPEEGLKTIYVRWGDMYGNWGMASDSIMLDWRGPIGDAVIEDGAGLTDSTAVTVDVPASDAGSGVSIVALSNDGTFWTNRSYAPSIAWSLASGDGIKTVRVKWRDGNGHWSAVKTDTIKLDTVAPTVTEPRRGLVAATNIDTGRITVRVPWSGSDATSGIARYELLQSTDGGPWTTVSTTLTSPTVDRSLASLHTYRFRVRAIDKAGNVGAWVFGPTFRLSRYSEFNSAIAYSGSWAKVSSPVYWGGAARRSGTAGARAAMTFTGRSVAWVARTGPNRGIATVYVNGTKVATVDLYSPSYGNQRVVWARNWSSSATRTITIRVSGTPGRPLVDVDAFVTAN